MATFGTFVSGQVLTAAELNSAGDWEDYTPTWTQSATITKTVNWARYTQLGKWVQGSVKMTASSAGTANNKVLVGLPVNASTNNFVIGNMIYRDVSSANFTSVFFPCFFESATTMSFHPGRVATSVNGSYTEPSDDSNLPTTDVRFGQNYTSLGNSSITGIVVASSDIIYIQFAYEAA